MAGNRKKEPITLLSEADSTGFDPEGTGFDMDTAIAAGMTPAGPEAGENEGHFGSVVRTTPEERERFDLPENSFLVLKGKNHPTFDKAVKAEHKRGFVIKKFGDRYFSVPDKAKGRRKKRGNGKAQIRAPGTAAQGP